MNDFEPFDEAEAHDLEREERADQRRDAERDYPDIPRRKRHRPRTMSRDFTGPYGDRR